jgi:hypothetical protein
MWYRLAQSLEGDNNEADRQTLDMTGGVRSRKTPESPLSAPPIPQPVIEPEILPEEEPQIEEIPDTTEVEDEQVDEGETPDTFTDYTPPSSAEEDQVAQAQDMYRAEDLAAIMDGAGVEYPMHESCRCRIQFRPDDSAGDLLVPRWEVSSGACNDCLNAQQMFNQYVEQTGVRVQPPGSANA